MTCAFGTDLHFAEVPCYDNPHPIRHHRGLFWPHPLDVQVLFLPEALDRGVTESQIRWVMEHDPERLVCHQGQQAEPGLRRDLRNGGYLRLRLGAQ